MKNQNIHLAYYFYGEQMVIFETKQFTIFLIHER